MSGRRAEEERGPGPERSGIDANRQFVKTLVRVLGVQVITLVLLWLLQSHFSF